MFDFSLGSWLSSVTIFSVGCIALLKFQLCIIAKLRNTEDTWSNWPWTSDVERLLAGSVTYITLMMPLLCISSTEVRFMNSFPNSLSNNWSLKLHLGPQCLCNSLTSSSAVLGSPFWRVSLWLLLSPRITLTTARELIHVGLSLWRKLKKRFHLKKVIPFYVKTHFSICNGKHRFKWKSGSWFSNYLDIIER